MDTKALVETAKTILRGLYFALVGVVGLILTVVATSPEVAQASITLPLVGEVNVGVVIVAGVGAAAKAIDRYVHKNKNNDKNGIAPKFLQG